VRFAANFTEISIFAMSVGAFLGLGLSIDYALLLVQRFREEIGDGADVEDAVAATLDTAGAPSGSRASPSRQSRGVAGRPAAVLRSVAIGGVLVIASALIGALLLLPALLAWLGPNVNAGRSAARATNASRAASGCGWRTVDAPSGARVFGCVASSPRSRPVPADAQRHARFERARPRLRGASRGRGARGPAAFRSGRRLRDPVIVATQGSPLEPANLRSLRRLIAEIEAVPGVEGVRSPVRDLDPERSRPKPCSANGERTDRLAAPRMTDGDAAC